MGAECLLSTCSHNVKKFTQTKIENRKVNTVYAVIYKYVMKT